MSKFQKYQIQFSYFFNRLNSPFLRCRCSTETRMRKMTSETCEFGHMQLDTGKIVLKEIFLVLFLKTSLTNFTS